MRHRRWGWPIDSWSQENQTNSISHRFGFVFHVTKMLKKESLLTQADAQKLWKLFGPSPEIDQSDSVSLRFGTYGLESV